MVSVLMMTSCVAMPLDIDCCRRVCEAGAPTTTNPRSWIQQSRAATIIKRHWGSIATSICRRTPDLRISAGRVMAADCVMYPLPPGNDMSLYSLLKVRPALTFKRHSSLRHTSTTCVTRLTTEAINPSSAPCQVIGTASKLDHTENGRTTCVNPAILSTCPVLQVNSCHRVSPASLHDASQRDSGMFADSGETHITFSSAALAVAAAVAATSSTGVRISVIGDGPPTGVFAAPTEEFSELCHLQLQMCKELMGDNVRMTVYLRTPESYASGQLELWQIASGSDRADVLERHDGILHISSSDVSLPPRFAEQALVKHEVVELEERQALVLPLARGSFLAGLLIIERHMAAESSAVSSQQLDDHLPSAWTEVESLPPKQTFPSEEQDPQSAASMSQGVISWESISSIPGPSSLSICSMSRMHRSKRKPFFTIEERAGAAKIAQSLATACIMDQRSLLLQKSSWQKGLRLDGGLEQMRGPLTALRTIGRLLRQQLQKEEMSRDMVEDMLVQGDRLHELIQQLQKTLYAPQPMGTPHHYSHDESEPGLQRSRLAGSSDAVGGAVMPNRNGLTEALPGSSLWGKTGEGPQSLLPAPRWPDGQRDEEVPMPPLTLGSPAIMQNGFMSSDVSSILSEVMSASEEVARQKAVAVHYHDLPHSSMNLTAAVEPSPLRQALCNVIDNGLQSAPSGGWLRVDARAAPAGGVLIVVADNGPGLSVIAQAFTLGVLSGRLQSKSTPGHAAVPTDRLRTHVTTDEGTRPLPAIGLAIARDLIEGMGGVLRVDSPFLPGTGNVKMTGTRVELWLPAVLHNSPITLAETSYVEVDTTSDMPDNVEKI